MSNRRTMKKGTTAEAAYVGSTRKQLALKLVEGGRAQVLEPRRIPEPLRGFLRRERRIVHVELSPSSKRQLEETSKALGVRPDKLARRKSN